VSNSQKTGLQEPFNVYQDPLVHTYTYIHTHMYSTTVYASNSQKTGLQEPFLTPVQALLYIHTQYNRFMRQILKKQVYKNRLTPMKNRFSRRMCYIVEHFYFQAFSAFCVTVSVIFMLSEHAGYVCMCMHVCIYVCMYGYQMCCIAELRHLGYFTRAVCVAICVVFVLSGHAANVCMCMCVHVCMYGYQMYVYVCMYVWLSNVLYR
jgi:hypothetical protein